MMNHRLRVFQQVAELRSITKAARLLHISQPTVTKNIKLLEEELRVQLFIRSARGVIITEAGVTLLRHVQQVAKAHDAIMQSLQQPTGNLTGRIRLGSSKTVLAYYLPRVLSAFKKRYPDVTCDIIEENADIIIGALLDQRIDVGLIEGPCGRPEIRIQPFYEDEIIWVAAPSHPLATARRPTAAQLLASPLILREHGAGARRYMEQALRQMRLRQNPHAIIQEAPNPETMKRLIADGLGIGYLYRISVADELANGDLVRIHCPKLEIRRPFSLLFPQGPDPMGIAQTFIQFLTQPAN